MRKLITLFILLATSISANAQFNKDTVGLKIPVKDGIIYYEGIVEQSDFTKKDLYANAKQWFVNYFVSSKEVIQNEDKEDGLIIGKGIGYMIWKTALISIKYNQKMTIQISVKDGKYRYRIYDIQLITQGSDLGTFGYVSSNTFNSEDLINKLTDQPHTMTFSKGQCKKILLAMNDEVFNTIESLKKAMMLKPDTF